MYIKRCGTNFEYLPPTCSTCSETRRCRRCRRNAGVTTVPVGSQFQWQGLHGVVVPGWCWNSFVQVRNWHVSVIGRSNNHQGLTLYIWTSADTFRLYFYFPLCRSCHRKLHRSKWRVQSDHEMELHVKGSEHWTELTVEADDCIWSHGDRGLRAWDAICRSVGTAE